MSTEKPTTWSDSYLDQVKARNRDYMDLLFSAMNPYLYRFLKSWNISQLESEDLLQETWRIFFAKMDEYRGESQIKTFLCGILLNQMREHSRGKKRMLAVADFECVLGTQDALSGWWERPSPNPEEWLFRRELLNHVHRSLQNLPEDQETAFFLKEINELETKEICQVMQITSSHCGVLIFRAKKHLRESLQEYLSDMSEFDLAI